MRIVGFVVAVVLVLVGVLWTLQGNGVLGETSGGERTFALVGPLLAGLGVALGIVIVQHWMRGRR